MTTTSTHTLPEQTKPSKIIHAWHEDKLLYAVDDSGDIWVRTPLKDGKRIPKPSHLLLKLKCNPTCEELLDETLDGNERNSKMEQIFIELRSAMKNKKWLLLEEWETLETYTV